jgi:molybdopterin-guanine dinucleotide biosynthesis protein A
VNYSAIVLAEDCSIQLGQDKGLLDFNNKPLFMHVVNAVKAIVDETIIVTTSPEQSEKYGKVAGSNVKFAVAPAMAKDPFMGALSGFEVAAGKYSLLLNFDAPFISKDVVELLFELCPGRSAVIPRWPDTQIEPLHAVYRTQAALEAAKLALNDGKLSLDDMVDNLGGVRYVSTLVIQELDPELKTFFRINTPVDLKKALVMLKPRKSKHHSL